MNHQFQISLETAQKVVTAASSLKMPLGSLALAPPTYPSVDLDPGGQDRVEVILVKNTSGGTLVPGNVLARDISTTDKSKGYGVVKAATSIHPERVVGVVPETLYDENGTVVTAIADGDYFFAVRNGNVKILTNTDNVTGGLGIIVSNAAAGAGKNAGATTGAAFGYWLADGTAPALTLAKVNCRG